MVWLSQVKANSLLIKEVNDEVVRKVKDMRWMYCSLIVFGVLALLRRVYSAGLTTCLQLIDSMITLPKKIARTPKDAPIRRQIYLDKNSSSK